LFSRLFKDVPKVMVPILWFTQTAELSDNLANLTKLLVSLPAIGFVIFFGLGGIGALLIVSGLVITLRKGWEEDEIVKLLGSDSPLRTPVVVREMEMNKGEADT
jgi:hypothetical protein